MNPAQFGETGGVAGDRSEYFWDQTILQTTGTDGVSYARDTATGGLKLNLATAGENQPFALVQYLDQTEASKFAGTKLSVNINGYAMANGGVSAQATPIQVKIFANASFSQFGTATQPNAASIIDLSASGEATLTSAAETAGWYEINRSNLPTASASLPVLSGYAQILDTDDLMFNGWAVDDEIRAAASVQGVAVVVTVAPPTAANNYYINFDSISVCPGDIATRPAPKSYAQTLSECQRYYEMSYVPNGLRAPYTGASGCRLKTMPLWPNNNNTFMISSGFSETFQTEKRIVPSSDSVVIYPLGALTANHVAYRLTRSTTVVAGNAPLSGFWSTLTPSKKGFYLDSIAGTDQQQEVAVIVANNNPVSSRIAYQFIADCRIGVI